MLMFIESLLLLKIMFKYIKCCCLCYYLNTYT
nr:MAG TPA: hypothetical protein [Caudoviricetes sp.]